MRQDPFDSEEEESSEGFPLTDAIDKAVVMHRDAHFAGKFDVMLEYYQGEGKGIHPDITVERIQRLTLMERELKQNIAAVMLSGADAEKVSDARTAYKELRDLYGKGQKRSPYPLLIADLILSEEEVPQAEMDAIVACGDKIVPFLIDLLKSDIFHDPLFPGYGQAPTLAAQCLGKIGGKGAIIALFEAIGEEDFFDQDIMLKALQEIGEPAKNFLLTVVKGRPFTSDNETAAMALASFKHDPEVARNSLRLLQDPKVMASFSFATYLALTCEGLDSDEDREQFLALSKEKSTPPALRRDIEAVARSWKHY